MSEGAKVASVAREVTPRSAAPSAGLAAAGGHPALATFNFAEQYGPLALGLTSRRLSLPGGDLAGWLGQLDQPAGIVISVVFLVLLLPDGRPGRPHLATAGAGAGRPPGVRGCRRWATCSRSRSW